MKPVKFSEEFSHKISDRVTKTWPAGWPAADNTGAEISTEAAYAARRAGKAVFVGDEAEKHEAEFLAHEAERKAKEAVIAIPDDWKSFKAADMVDLARNLGAPEEIATKDPAFDFIAAEVAKRGSLI